MIDCRLVCGSWSVLVCGSLVLWIAAPLNAETAQGVQVAAIGADGAMSGFGNPLWSPDGHKLALSDSNGNGVYVYDVRSCACTQVAAAPSSGYAYNWSHDSRRLGFKLLIPVPGRIFPLQMPAVFDIQQRKFVPLHVPVARAGVPCFSDKGQLAFTIGEELQVVDASGTLVKRIELGCYANLVPISPDGTAVAFCGEDQGVWLLELDTGARMPLTVDEDAYFNPVWSPDSRRLVVSTTSGRLKCIEVANGQIRELDQGVSPSWSADSMTVFYSRVDRVDGVRVRQAGIWQIRCDGGGKKQLAAEAAENEADARISPDGEKMAFVSMANGELCWASVSRDGSGESLRNDGYSLGSKVRMTAAASPLVAPDAGVTEVSDLIQPDASTKSLTGSPVTLLRPVPYLHQVYDTPDSFDGNWACGASSALMAINYFDVLEYWDVTCSWPYSHVSHYGQYVSEIYTFNGYTYDIRSKDASSNWAYGGYGYIVRDNWADTKGYMRDYINNHGLSSAVDWSPTWAKLQMEVDNDDPFVVLNSLTTAGHYIVAIGYYPDQYTAVFNDPYGNKNTPGYPSYDGESVLYDWPGYSNGFANLNTVHCFIYCRGDLPPVIQQHPVSQEVPWGDNMSFTVAGGGEGPLTYQWQKNGSNLVNGGHIAGVTASTLCVFNVTDLQAGGYSCVVTNSHGSTASNTATLTVTGPPVTPGDMDRDGDVDQKDFGLFQCCLSGTSVAQNNPACADALLDNDTDVDQIDCGLFIQCMSAPGEVGDPYCAD